jgi:hypothetical protein
VTEEEEIVWQDIFVCDQCYWVRVYILYFPVLPESSFAIRRTSSNGEIHSSCCCFVLEARVFKYWVAADVLADVVDC